MDRVIGYQHPVEFAHGDDRYHQQYLSESKNPYGYCNHGPNGMSCPIGIGAGDAQTSIEVPGATH